MTEPITRHHVAATLDQVPLTLLDGDVTLDAEWAPYARVEVTVPATPALLALDPRNGAPHLSLTLTEATGDPFTLGTAFEDYWGQPLATLSLTFTTLSQVSAQFSLTFAPPVPFRASSRSVYLPITAVDADHVAGRVTLTASGRETDAQQDGLLSPAPVSYVPTTLVDLARLLLGSGVAATTTMVLDGLDLTRDPGQASWDFLEPLVDLAAARLWCDEGGTWHLDPATLTGRTLTDLAVTRLRTSVDTAGGEWGQGVVVTTEHVTGTGETLRTVDVAGSGPPVVVIRRSTRVPGTGSAAAILARTQRRGRRSTLTAVSRYDVTPGDTIPGHGQVTRVSWDLAGHTMTLTTRED